MTVPLCSLGKTIQTLTRIVEGMPTKADLKAFGGARTTLYVYQTRPKIIILRFAAGLYVQLL